MTKVPNSRLVKLKWLPIPALIWTALFIGCRWEGFSQIGLECFTDLDAIVVWLPFTDGLAITAAHLKNYELKNKAVLLYTGWAEHWNTELYYDDHPFVTEEAALYLRDSGAKLVGIDSHNIDDTSGRTRPTHTTLLGAGILL
jgi:arylformamidase